MSTMHRHNGIETQRAQDCPWCAYEDMHRQWMKERERSARLVHGKIDAEESELRCAAELDEALQEAQRANAVVREEIKARAAATKRADRLLSALILAKAALDEAECFEGLRGDCGQCLRCRAQIDILRVLGEPPCAAVQEEEAR